MTGCRSFSRGEQVNDTVQQLHELPDLAELRRLAEACPMPHNDPDTFSEWYEFRDLTVRDYTIPPKDAAYIAAASPAVVLGLLDDADALRAELAHMTEARDNARAEQDALRTWQERVAVAAGIGEEVEGRGVYLEANPDAAAEHVAGLLAVADTHIECPVYCGGCGEPLADALCDHCSGSGCGPGTALGAYEECGWCAGAGKVHPGCADLSYADLVAERDALAAKVAALADWHETKAEKARRFRIEIDGRNPVMDKAAEVHTDAARRLRAALDEEPQP